MRFTFLQRHSDVGSFVARTIHNTEHAFTQQSLLLVILHSEFHTKVKFLPKPNTKRKNKKNYARCAHSSSVRRDRSARAVVPTVRLRTSNESARPTLSPSTPQPTDNLSQASTELRLCAHYASLSCCGAGDVAASATAQFEQFRARFSAPACRGALFCCFV